MTSDDEIQRALDAPAYPPHAERDASVRESFLATFPVVTLDQVRELDAEAAMRIADSRASLDAIDTALWALGLYFCRIDRRRSIEVGECRESHHELLPRSRSHEAAAVVREALSALWAKAYEAGRARGG